MTRPLPVWHLKPASPSSRVLVFQDNNLICSSDTDPLFSHDAATKLGDPSAEPLLVAHWRGEDIYALSVPGSFEHQLPARSLRSLLAEGPSELSALASTAVQLLHWRRDNRFCGRCGEPTYLLEKERACYCENCRHRLFPRLSPCVIVAIQHGEKVLLAQSHRSGGQFYSLIAGFVEPGESAEEAVHREVAEETGLQVTNLRYIESEPWAFPHQLMLGYLADYASGDVVLEAEELAAADWFSARDLPTVPGDWTIAGRLIRHALEVKH